MLSYFLAIAIVTVSLGLYLTAFLAPKIHRRDDFLWSGLGLFYGLILWVCAERITGAVLLGQLAATSVMVAFIWETRQLRKIFVSQQTALQGTSVLDLMLSLLAKLGSIKIGQPATNGIKNKSSQTNKVTETTSNETIKEVIDNSEILQNVKNETSNLVEEKATDIENKLTSVSLELKNEALDITENVIEKIEIPSIEDQKQKIQNLTENVTETLETVTTIGKNELDSTVEKIDNKIEEIKEDVNKPDGFFGRLWKNLRKPIGKKTNSPVIEKKEENILLESIDNTIENFIEIEEVKIEDISGIQNAQEIENAINNLDINTLNNLPISINTVTEEIESDKEESSSIFETSKDTDSYEIIDENEENEIELNFQNDLTNSNQSDELSDSDFDFDEEIDNLKIESTSLSQGEEEIDLNDNIINESSVLEMKDITLSQIPEEDKISMLTDLTLEELELQDNEKIISLNSELENIFAESESVEGKISNEIQENKDVINDLDDILSNLDVEEGK